MFLINIILFLLVGQKYLCLVQVFTQTRPHIITEKFEFPNCTGPVTYQARLLNVCTQRPNLFYVQIFYNEETKRITESTCENSACTVGCNNNTYALPSDLNVCASDGSRYRITDLDPNANPEYPSLGNYVTRVDHFACSKAVPYDLLRLMTTKCIKLKTKYYIAGLLNNTHSFLHDFRFSTDCAGTPNEKTIFENTTGICIEENELFPKKIYKTCYGLIYEVDSNTCSGNGECNSTDSCLCKPGWLGQQCETPVCGGCSGNGICLQPNNCTCNVGWVGANCSVAECGGCSGNGRCLQPNNCTCNAGWGGSSCSVAACGGCSGNGRCLQPNVCTCNSGWTGATCNQQVTSSRLCFGIPSDNSTVCSGNGICNSTNTCICVGGYAGNSCQFPTCFGVSANLTTTCNGNGRCTSPNNCVCNTGFVAPSCTKATNGAGVLALSFALIIFGFIFLF